MKKWPEKHRMCPLEVGFSNIKQHDVLYHDDVILHACDEFGEIDGCFSPLLKTDQ